MKRVNLVLILLSILLVSACSLPGLGAVSEKKSIKIASLSSTEGQILSFMVEGMVEHYMDVDTQVINNLGSSTVNYQALKNGDANVSGVKYTGTSLTGPLGQEPITDPELALSTVIEGFDKEFNLKWYPSYGFANTYAFLVTKETAEKYGLKKVSDLETYADKMTAGVDSSWIERKGDGYKNFKKTYSFDFNRVYPMQIGLVYDALEAGEMDVILGYSTDGRIASYDLVVLEDDKNLFPPYDASPVASKEILEEYPELDDVLLKLKNSLTQEKMQQLNYEADNNLLEPKVVAQKFLEDNHFFEKSVSNSEGGK
ncbi:MAG: osmoprotectant ABC transporter substrate-binding protein [Pisciglobus halotolerans]|nr:osmoprotectant ABC transporter substrate-binding protein [Pisciglobus halotolerans]